MARRRAAGGAREDEADRRPPRWFRLPRRITQRGRACHAVLTYARRPLRFRVGRFGHHPPTEAATQEIRTSKTNRLPEDDPCRPCHIIAPFFFPLGGDTPRESRRMIAKAEKRRALNVPRTCLIFKARDLANAAHVSRCKARRRNLQGLRGACPRYTAKKASQRHYIVGEFPPSRARGRA